MFDAQETNKNNRYREQALSVDSQTNGRREEMIENGKTEVPSILLTSTPVTKENINETVIAEEFVSPAELCEGAFAAACKENGIKGGG